MVILETKEVLPLTAQWGGARERGDEFDFANSGDEEGDSEDGEEVEEIDLDFGDDDEDLE